MCRSRLYPFTPFLFVIQTRKHKSRNELDWYIFDTFIQTVNMQVICTHLKLWVAIARHNKWVQISVL